MEDKNPRYQPGKCPILYDLTPASITAFLSNLEFYFDMKNLGAADDRAKIGWTGQGLSMHMEMRDWFAGNRVRLLTMTWLAFADEFLERSFPRDYVFDIQLEIFQSAQGTATFMDWAKRLRAKQLQTGGAFSDLNLVTMMIYNMDPELRRVIRRDPILKSSGLHGDDLDQVARRCLAPSPVTTWKGRVVVPHSVLSGRGQRLIGPI